MSIFNLKKDVINNVGKRFEVIRVIIADYEGVEMAISYGGFVDTFKNYVDPKDAEIARLKAEIDRLKGVK